MAAKKLSDGDAAGARSSSVGAGRSENRHSDYTSEDQALRARMNLPQAGNPNCKD